MRVALGLVLCDRYELLEKTWERLQQTVPAGLEYLFVDSGSEDKRIIEWLTTLRHVDSWLVPSAGNEGIAPARNRILRAAQRGGWPDVLIMLDPDILLPDGWYEACLSLLEVPEVGLVSVNCEGNEYETVTLDGHRMQIKDGNIAGLWVFPKRTLEKVGYFSEDYRWYGGEDSDYGARVRLAGLLNVYVADMTAEHLGHDDGLFGSSDSFYRLRKALWFQANMLRFNQYHQEYAEGKRPLLIDSPGSSLVAEGRPGVPVTYQPTGFALEVGAGVAPVEGFVHLDVQRLPHIEIVHDVTVGPVQLPDGCVDQLYTSHFLEHLPWRFLPQMLSEFHRLLKPGGTLEIHVPDLGKMDRLGWEELQLNLCGGQEHPHDAHLSAFRWPHLKALCEGAGFTIATDTMASLGDFDLAGGFVK